MKIRTEKSPGVELDKHIYGLDQEAFGYTFRLAIMRRPMDQPRIESVISGECVFLR